MTASLDTEQLAAVLQLSSPSLPIGGFSYSQGLEAAVELRLVHGEASAHAWIEHHLMMVVARSEAPLWCLLYDAWQAHDEKAVHEWSQWFHASRETHELRQETEQMGLSLAKLSKELSWADAEAGLALGLVKPLTLPCVHAFLCAAWRLPRTIGLGAYLFAWLENQVTSAVKSVPIGQVAGQRILTHLRRRLPEVVDAALERAAARPPRLDTFAPQFAIISSRHESQFSRLFRS